ncbi:MAG: bifunctional isocitrate dehydrogenase kinase/phosphatase [Rhizobiales bacterium]|nr:bifunctional isocitrate dehydrogenase kinase/phosphatase [Hyphomicrobiales bacterium]
MVEVRKRDFGTLNTQRIVDEARERLAQSLSEAETAAIVADIILAAFDDYYQRSGQIPGLAKKAFETRDWPTAIALSQERIAIYSLSIDKIGPFLKEARVDVGQDHLLWQMVEQRCAKAVEKRYEADMAIAYLASVRRYLHRSTWQPELDEKSRAVTPVSDFVVRLRTESRMTAETVEAFLDVHKIGAPYRNRRHDAEQVAARINSELVIGGTRPLEQVDVLNAGFYRNRGAYIIGSITVAGDRTPLALALLNRDQGIEVDAVILRQTTLAHVFSSTLANFHVTARNYHDVVDYLYELMPLRPRSEHYSTIGYHHIGKIAVMNQIKSGLTVAEKGLDHAPGPRGSVAMGFTNPDIRYVMKVIRDKPTDQYKWGKFNGLASVLGKYHAVHEINRSGSMLDNVIYSNLLLPQSIFEAAFLEELLEQAQNSVERRGDMVLFQHLIVQRKLVPVPLYLENCSEREAEIVVIRLGQCIRNNAATGVFNKDLDGRNYGVSALRFVYLFDYDAVETLSDVKIRTNTDRDADEEGIPDWFFEDGVIFLPEEMEAHLRLPTKALRRLFREAHGELLTVDYWKRMQDWLNEGRVPAVRTYPRSTQLSLKDAEGNLILRPASA